MGDKTCGLYDKFIIERRDGRSAVGEKHNNCDYFVLDLTHDPYAIEAVIAYAEACRGEYPLLAADLDKKTAGFQAGFLAGIRAERELNKMRRR